MADMHVNGYGVDATFDGDRLHVHPHNRAARTALSGKFTDAETQAMGQRIDDETTERLARRDEQDTHTTGEVAGDIAGGATSGISGAMSDHASDVDLAVGEIASVDWKDASMLTNGRLTITSTAGRVHVLHFRRKQQHDMAELRDALMTGRR